VFLSHQAFFAGVLVTRQVLLAVPVGVEEPERGAMHGPMPITVTDARRTTAMSAVQVPRRSRETKLVKEEASTAKFTVIGRQRRVPR